MGSIPDGLLIAAVGDDGHPETTVDSFFPTYTTFAKKSRTPRDCCRRRNYGRLNWLKWSGYTFSTFLSVHS